jgi:hypothetical protein
MPETLSDLLKQAQKLHANASGRRLAEIADANPKWGGTIDRTQVNAILKGTYKSKPGPKLLRAIAGLAGVDVERAYQAAGMPLPGPPFAEDLPPDVDYLTPRQRRAIVTVIQAFLSSESKESDPDERSSSTTAGAEAGSNQQDYDLAALDLRPGQEPTDRELADLRDARNELDPP